MRRVLAVNGRHRVRAVLALAADYGRRPLGRWRRRPDGWVATGEGLSAPVVRGQQGPVPVVATSPGPY